MGREGGGAGWRSWGRSRSFSRTKQSESRLGMQILGPSPPRVEKLAARQLPELKALRAQPGVPPLRGEKLVPTRHMWAACPFCLGSRSRQSIPTLPGS